MLSDIREKTKDLDASRIALVVSVTSLLVISVAAVSILPEDGFETPETDKESHSNHNHSHGGKDSGPEDNLKAGTAHAHALFFVEVNGSELNLSTREYQLQSPYVHLENGRSHTVHKHAENVTWRYFLNTIDISLEQSGSETCLKTIDTETCGNLTVSLNGNTDTVLEKEIQQGDNLAIVLEGPENATRKYMEKKLDTEFRRSNGNMISQTQNPGTQTFL